MCPDIPRAKTFCFSCAKIGFPLDLFINMDIFETSAPLVLSCTLRPLFDPNKIAILADNLLIVSFVQWKPHFLPALLIALSILIGFAFYETRAEYMCSKGNIRENTPDNSIEHRGFSSTAVSYPSASNLKSDICPIIWFGIPRFTANTHHPS
jgi:hypothetical protein